MKSSVKTEGCFVVLKFEGFIIHQIGEQLENLSTCLPIGPQLCTTKLHGNNNEKPEVQKHRFWAAGSLFYTITKLYFLTVTYKEITRKPILGFFSFIRLQNNQSNLSCTNYPILATSTTALNEKGSCAANSAKTFRFNVMLLLFNFGKKRE